LLRLARRTKAKGLRADEFLGAGAEGGSASGGPEALVWHLQQLSFEDVKMLQCVTYLGRDGDYDPSDSPEERYDQVRRNLDAVGWGSQKVEASQLAEKAPLGEYLQDGLRALLIVM